MNQNDQKNVNFMNTNQIIMEGILYLTDEKNKRRFIQIDMDKYDKDLLEDFVDGLVAESRKDDEKITLEVFTAELKKEGLL